MSSELLAFADGLAGLSPPAPDLGEVRQYVAFSLRDHELAIAIASCREIVRPGSITRVPEAPAEVRGVVNLRGRIVPVVDMHLCLGLGPGLLGARSRLLGVETAGRYFALLVDRVTRILKLRVAEVRSPAQPPRFPALAGVTGAGDATTYILDVEQLLLTGPGVAKTTQATEKE